ncbi:hypothetical protein Tco_0499523 [Tanacetum coccineum]
MIFNIDSAIEYSYSNDDTCFSIDVIDEILEEDFDALLDEGSKILHSIKGTVLEEEFFFEFDKFIAMSENENYDSGSDEEELISNSNLFLVSGAGLEVEKAKIYVISKLPPPTNIKEIKDRKGTKNVASDHLSRIKNDESSNDSDVDDNFPEESLMEINTKNEPWFIDFANYLVAGIIPKGMTYQQKNKFFSDLKHYFWEEPYLLD